MAETQYGVASAKSPELRKTGISVASVIGSEPVAGVDTRLDECLVAANKLFAREPLTHSKNTHSGKNVVRENSGTRERELSSGKSCPVQQRPQLLARTTYRGIKKPKTQWPLTAATKDMTTNAQSCHYTNPHREVAQGGAEHRDPTSYVDSEPQHQAQPTPAAPIDAGIQDAALNDGQATAAESTTLEAPVMTESKRATVVRKRSQVRSIAEVA